MLRTIIALVGVAVAAAAPAWAQPVIDAEVLAILRNHCVACHAREPAHAAFAKPPRDVILETIEDLKTHAEKTYEQTVDTRAMPMGNQSQMTEDERAALARWIKTRT